MDAKEKTAPEQVLVIDGQEYAIDKDTAKKLKDGVIPPDLQAEITARQKEKRCHETTAGFSGRVFHS